MTGPGARDEGEGEGDVVVLGLGNPLLGDDGAGLALLERVQAHGPWPDGVQFVDGGTWGLSLLPTVTDARRLLVLDAVRTAHPPGTVVRGEGAAVPRMYRHPASPHQVDLQEVLAAATLLGRVPELVVVGIEPESTGTPDGELRIGLSDPVSAAVPRAAAEAARVLRAWCGADLVRPG